MKIINSVPEESIITMCGSGQFSHQNLKEDLTPISEEITCEKNNKEFEEKKSA